MSKKLISFQPAGGPDGTIIWDIKTDDGNTVAYSMSMDIFCRIVGSLPPFATAILSQRSGVSDPDIKASAAPSSVTGAGVNHALDGGKVELVVDLAVGIRNTFALTPALARSLGESLIDHSKKAAAATPSSSLN